MKFNITADRSKAFIKNVTNLTIDKTIKWDIMPIKYDYSKLSQFSCTRFTCKWGENTFIISHKNKFNFEVKFDELGIIENLPFADDECVQTELNDLFSEIIKRSASYERFNNIFNSVEMY